jgi:hypothetical protein
MGKLSRTSSVHFVPSSKEVSDTVIDVIVNGPVCSLSAAIAAGLQSLCEVGHTGKDFFMREIVVDTETTGLDPLDGHRAHLWPHSPLGKS